MRTLGLALLLLVAACAREPAHEYPDEVVENFVAACRTRAPEETCRCAIDRLRDQFPFDAFTGFERLMADGDVPPAVADAVGDCARR